MSTTPASAPSPPRARERAAGGAGTTPGRDEPVGMDLARDGSAGMAESHDTRERILEVALDLFTDQGYDKTSLREIAERVRVTKAALYYHFPSKLEILKALHYQLHDALGDAVGSLGELGSEPEEWVAVFDAMIDGLLHHRRHAMLHERNRAAFEELHRVGHDQSHNDIGDQMRDVLMRADVSVDDKIRLACVQGAVAGGLMYSGVVLGDILSEDLAHRLKGVVRDILGGGR